MIYIYPALMYAVMFYVILNKRKRLGDCVTFSYLSHGCFNGPFPEEAGHGHVMYGIIAFQSTGP